MNMLRLLRRAKAAVRLCHRLHNSYGGEQLLYDLNEAIGRYEALDELAVETQRLQAGAESKNEEPTP